MNPPSPVLPLGSDEPIELPDSSLPESSASETKQKRRALEVFSLIVGALGLAIGAYHLYELGHVQKAISTQYLGQFPDFLPNVREIVNMARHDLIIACDFPGYGDFSDPDNALKYLQAVRIRQADKRLRVEFTCLDADRRREALLVQFPASKWGNWRGDSQQRVQVEEFLRLNGRDPANIRTLPQLFAAMDSIDLDVLRQTFLGRANQTSEHMQIYFWIADCRRAVFSIASPGGTGIEHGFTTSDRSLIKALLELRSRYVQSGTTLRQPCE